MRNLLIYHFIPLSISAILIGCVLWFISTLDLKTKAIEPESIQISEDSIVSRGFSSNLSSEKSQINLFSSFENNSLTIFGSSEFNSSPYCPYYFLPDNSNIPTFGVGQGFHQSLSVLVECLSFSDEIEGKKISIILSPGWFESNGTNTNAFIKFANTNILNRVILNPEIPEKYTNYIGKYIYENQSEIATLSYQMEYLKNQYQKKLQTSISNLAGKLNQKIQGVIPVSYSFDTIIYQKKEKSEKVKRENKAVNYNKIGDSLQGDFISSVTNNSYFVNDEYYEKYMKNGSKRYVNPLDVNNHELADFEILVDFLTMKNAKVSVIMQPLNPHFFDNLEAMSPVLDRIDLILNEKGIPFLNLYAKTTEEYEPGTLRDIMHFGDYGWIKVNAFLDSLYHE